MSINNREDANNYYNKVNTLVDDYLEKWKIRPSNLKRYLKPGSDRFNKFLEKNKLKDIRGIDTILKDVIEDRDNMESDGVVTFESFKMLESDEFKFNSLKQCLYKGIEKADLNMEKFLADYYDTNLGSINVVDAGKHVFSIDDWEGQDKVVVVYSGEELGLIKLNIIDALYEEVCQSKVSLSNSIEIDLKGLVDHNSFVEGCKDKFSQEFFCSVISGLLGPDYKLEGSSSEFTIWTTT